MDDHDRPDKTNPIPPAVAQVLARAEAGDDSALPALKALLDAHAQVWMAAGDLAGHAESALLQLVAGSNLFYRESLKRRLAEVRAALAPQSPLERLLAERLALAWAEAHAAQMEALSRAALAPGDIELTRALQLRLDGASKRFLAAVRTLALTRKLLGKATARGSVAQGTPEAPQAERTGTASPDAPVPARPRRRGQLLEAVAETVRVASSGERTPRLGRPPPGRTRLHSSR